MPSVRGAGLRRREEARSKGYGNGRRESTASSRYCCISNSRRASASSSPTAVGCYWWSRKNLITAE
jgi:hypothetical protein